MFIERNESTPLFFGMYVLYYTLLLYGTNLWFPLNMFSQGADSLTMIEYQDAKAALFPLTPSFSLLESP